MGEGEALKDARAASAAASPGLRYEPGLDGLRALAVIAVLLFHDGRLRGGFLGVSTFFTLSGFLITRLLLSEWNGAAHISLRRFYSRRIRRLLPAALAGLVVAAAVTAALHDPQTSRDFRLDSLAAVVNVANWRFLWSGRAYANLFAAPSPLQHYWSLSVEEQFYLLLAPVIVAVLAVARGRRVVIGVVLGALAAGSFVDGWLAVSHGIDRAYYGTDTRALEFLVGSVLAVVMAQRTLGRRVSRVVASFGPVAVVGLALAMTQARVGDAGLFRGGLLAYALGGCALLLAACEPGPMRGLLSTPPLRQLGRISYGVYVYHWPLFLWLSPARTQLDPLELTALRMATTLAVATVSYVFIEQPIRERRRIAERGRWVAAPTAVATVVLCALMVAALAPPAAVTFAPTQSASAVLAESRASTATSSTAPSPSTAGMTIAPVRLQRVLVVGDSVALTLGRGIERWGQKNNVYVWNQGMLGCTLLEGAAVRGYWGVQTRPTDSCGTRELWPRDIKRFNPQVVVVLYGAWDVYDASFDHGQSWTTPGQPAWNRNYAAEVRAATRRLAAGGAKVLWLTPPCFAEKAGTPGADAPWFSPARVDVIGSIDRAVAATNGMAVSNIVHDGGCPVDFASRPDGTHYADAGADAVMRALGPEIERVGTASLNRVSR